MVKGLHSRLLGLTMLVSMANPGSSADPGATEYQLKAAFLYNFVKFVEWPAAGQSGPLALCVLGKDPFDGELERAADGKTVNGRTLVVRRVNEAAAPSCQVLFVSSSEAGKAAEIVKKVAGQSVLTVSDIDGFSACGGVIHFLMEGQRVRFHINQLAAERASLKISSKLLQLSVASDEKGKDQK